MKFREADNLSWVFQSLWKLHHPDWLQAAASGVSKEERSFFDADDGPEMVCFKTYCPGWPPRSINLDPHDDVLHPHVVKAIADMWGLDSYVTLVVHATSADPAVLLVDEVAAANIGKRLVLCQGLRSKAAWLPLFMREGDCVKEFGDEACDFWVNRTRVDSWPRNIEDGDHLELRRPCLMCTEEVKPSECGDTLELRGPCLMCMEEVKPSECGVPQRAQSCKRPCHDPGQSSRLLNVATPSKNCPGYSISLPVACDLKGKRSTCGSWNWIAATAPYPFGSSVLER